MGVETHVSESLMTSPSMSLSRGTARPWSTAENSPIPDAHDPFRKTRSIAKEQCLLMRSEGKTILGFGESFHLRKAHPVLFPLGKY